MSPAGPRHLPECQDWRRAYREVFGHLTDAVCSCARIRREQLHEQDP